MFNPFDGAMFATGTIFLSAFGIINGSSPVLATAVGALITGTFLLLAKGGELAWKSWSDRRLKQAKDRIAELESQLRSK